MFVLEMAQALVSFRRDACALLENGMHLKVAGVYEPFNQNKKRENVSSLKSIGAKVISFASF